MGLLSWLAIVITGLFFAGSAGLVNLFPDKDKIDQYVSGGMCEPEVEEDVQIKVDIDADKEYMHDGVTDLYQSRETKTWVRIKQGAAIPAWKVVGGQGKDREGLSLGEMEEVGETVMYSAPGVLVPNYPYPTDTTPKDVHVGLGHCNGSHGPGATDPTKPCKDPLVQDAIFVPVVKGWQTVSDATDPSCFNEWPRVTEEECQQMENYWWTFDVYVDTSQFEVPAGSGIYNYTEENLPCWSRLACGGGDVMGDKRKELWQRYLDEGVCPVDEISRLTPQELVSSAYALDTPSLVTKAGIDTSLVTPAPDQTIIDQLKERYLYDSQVADPKSTLGVTAIGQYPIGSPKYNVFFLPSSKLLFLQEIGEDKYYLYQELTDNIIPDGSTLQLGTFQPIVGSFAYEWWTPACKPAIYLYPEVTTDLNVKVIPQGNLTKSIPSYPTSGWDVTANPSGKIQSLGKDYPYLFYEADIEKIKVPKEGWVVEVGELDRFFKDLLPKLGLNKQEQTDFTSYWVPKLLFHSLPTDSPYYYIGLLDREQLDKVEEIQFSQEPDNFIRLRFVFEALRVSQPAQAPIPNGLPKRTGFTAVDWGGILLNGTCEEGIAKDIESK